MRQDVKEYRERERDITRSISNVQCHPALKYQSID